jgi:pimeloyl-ACP methyl ester carboxylesterase
MTRMTRTSVSRRQLLTGALATGTSLGLFGATTIHAQAKDSPLVLVHGAWHGGWCWRRVADVLTAKGRYVVAPTLSGVGERSHLASDAINLSTHVDDVVNEIKWKDLDGLVLVGHSYGGMVITGVAERVRERIAAIVYLDAFMPEDGQSLATLAGPGAAAMPEHVVPPIPAATFRVNAKDAAWVDSKMTPHPVKCFTESLRVTGAYQTVLHKVYIRARDFPSTTFDAAFNRCQADRAWRTLEMKCGHDIMIDQPGELAAVLEGLGRFSDGLE